MIINKKNIAIELLNKYLIFMFIFFILRFINIKVYNSLSSIGILLNIIMIFSIVSVYFKEIYMYSKINLIVIFLILSDILINGLFNKFSFGGFTIILIFCIYLNSFSNINLSRKVIDKILLIMFLGFIVNFFIDKKSFNPNTLGQLTYIFMIYTSIYLVKKRYFLVITIIISYFSILESESRGALLAFIIFILIGFLIPKKILSKKIIFYSIILIFTIGSLVFCHIYIKMWINGERLTLNFSEKALYSGRERIWYELFNLIRMNPLTGVGSAFKLTTFDIFNSHNSILNIFVVYGIPVGILTIYLIINCFKKLRNIMLINKRNRLCFAGLCGFFIMAFFETNLIWEPIILQELFLLCIIRSNYEEKSL